MPTQKKKAQTVDNTVDKDSGDGQDIRHDVPATQSDPAERSGQDSRSEARQALVNEGQGTGVPTLTVTEREQLALDHAPYTFDETEVVTYEEWLHSPRDPRNVIGVHFTEGWIVLSNPLPPLPTAGAPDTILDEDGTDPLAVPPQDTDIRVAIVGSDSWPAPEMLARVLLNYWVSVDRAQLRIVLGGDTAFDQTVLQVVNTQKFPVEQHPANPDAGRTKVMQQLSSMIHRNADVLIVFIHNNDRWPSYAARLAVLEQVPLIVCRLDDDPQVAKLGLLVE